MKNIWCRCGDVYHSINEILEHLRIEKAIIFWTVCAGIKTLEEARDDFNVEHGIVE